VDAYAEAAGWKSLAEVRQTFPTAHLGGRLTVFNVRGNTYRLVARIGSTSRFTSNVAIYTLR
jgi:mRNA-degrading endonuclease HigB of HigAB toxin-antitoxin module